jgi:peptidyl-prolyl cis-trans isomerase D
MLDVLRRSQRWLMGAVMLVVGGVFVAYLGLGGPGLAPGGDSLIQLDGRRYGLPDLQRVRQDQEQRLRENLGDAFDSAAAGAYLDQMAAEQLVQRAVLASEAERVGLRATDDEVRGLVRSVFATPQGSLDAAGVRDFAERRFGSERRFADEVRDDLLSGKLLDLIDAGVGASEAEARDVVRYRREQVRVALVVLDPAKRPPGLEIDAAEIERTLAEQAPAVRRFYDEHPERYHQPERVRARHVLLRLAKGAPEEEVARVRAQAEAALARIRGGEDFEAVAREVSEDPGSKDKGGDLGFFPRGQMAPPFEQVAFSLEPGQTSEVVRTDFGFHVLRVEAHEPAQDQGFDEVARAIAEELVATERTSALAAETAEKLAKAVREGSSLVEAAREEDLPIERPDWIARRPDGFVPGIGQAPEVAAAAFSLTPEKPSSDRIFDVGGKRVLIELLERRGPTAEEMAAELAAERERLLETRRAEARNAWYRAARQRLLAERRLRIDLTPIEQPPPEPAEG